MKNNTKTLNFNMNFKNWFILFFLIDLIVMAFKYAKLILINPKLNIKDMPDLFKNEEAENC